MATTMEDDEWLYGDQTNAEESIQTPGDDATLEGSPTAEIFDSQDEIEIKKVVDLEEEERDGEPEVIEDGDMEMEDIPAPVEAHRKSGDDREIGELSGGEDDSTRVLVMEDGSEDSDSDDDDVQVTIGDIKTTPVNLNIKPGAGRGRGGTRSSGSKGMGIDLDSAGMINGVPAYEFNLDSMEEKPWRKPGADITDYFNYGFNEETWKMYCEKQRKLRGEGPAVVVSKSSSHLLAKDQQIPVASLNDNSKYSAGPPPGRKFSGAIDVIGGTFSTSRRPVLTPPKENVIQVMTGDKRDFVRKPFMEPGMMPSGGPPHMPPSGFMPPDLSIPPPVMAPPIAGMPPPGMPPGIPLPPPPAGMPPGYADPYGYPHRYPIPPMANVPGPPDRTQTPGYESRPPYYGPTNPNNFAHYEPNNEPQWEPHDRADSSFPPNWEYPHERSAERSPQRSPAPSHEEEAERKHSERHREKDRDRTRDKERDRDRDREKSRDRERDRERDRDRDYDYEERKSRDKDRERRHRDRDKDHRSSRRKHRDDDDTEHRSSRHKRKRSKRDKEDDGDTKDSGSMSENNLLTIAIKEEKKD